MIERLREPQSTTAPRRRKERGQSLVEFSLTLPILLLIVAGVLEVSNLLVNYNRLQLAAREAARFGAAGGSDAFIPQIVQDAATQSLDTDPNRLTVWIIRPVVSVVSSNPLDLAWQGADASNPWGVSEDCIYGNDCALGSNLNPGDVLNDLEQIYTDDVDSSATTDISGIDGKRVTIVAVYYETDTVLNLPFFDVGADVNGRVPLRAHAVLMQEVEQETVSRQQSGCTAYPIMLNRQLFYPGGSALHENDAFTATRNSEPTVDGFQFVAWHVIPSSGIYEWDANYLTISLTYPGNSDDATHGFVNIDDAGDNQMHRGDRVVKSNWEASGSASTIAAHIQSEFVDPDPTDFIPSRTLRLPVYDADASNPEYDSGLGTYLYRIDDFVVVRITNVDSNLASIDFEFVRWDTSCGYAAP
ncbi:MAG TPA: pilus assembly protein [Chloroflexi bacterium]|nr:pilus assembly protein [Chloroflexota bacterium]